MAGLEEVQALRGTKTGLRIIYSLQQQSDVAPDETHYLGLVNGLRPDLGFDKKADIHPVSFAVGDRTSAPDQPEMVDWEYQRFIETSVGGLTLPYMFNVSPIWRPPVESGMRVPTNPGREVVSAMQVALNQFHSALEVQGRPPTRKEEIARGMGQLMLMDTSSWVTLSNLGHLIKDMELRGKEIVLSAHMSNADMDFKLAAADVNGRSMFVGDADRGGIYADDSLAQAMQVQVYRRGEHF